jgi:hypothetical protein
MSRYFRQQCVKVKHSRGEKRSRWRGKPLFRSLRRRQTSFRVIREKLNKRARMEKGVRPDW